MNQFHQNLSFKRQKLDNSLCFLISVRLTKNLKLKYIEAVFTENKIFHQQLWENIKKKIEN